MTNRKNVEASSQDENNGGKKVKKKYTQTIFRDWCKSCGICAAFCPREVIVENGNGLPEISDPELCIGCRFCELHCPDFAITIKLKRDPLRRFRHVWRSSKQKIDQITEG